ncbi:hypothetical protein NKH93_25015 [Mesorhizobium sp. M0954]
MTNRGQITDVVAKAHAHFGRLDIVMNNAGYRLHGKRCGSGERDCGHGWSHDVIDRGRCSNGGERPISYSSC